MKYLAVLAAFALAACSPAERYSSRCQSYGWTPGTEGFASCLERQDGARRSAAAMWLAIPHTYSTYGGVTNAW